MDNAILHPDHLTLIAAGWTPHREKWRHPARTHEGRCKPLTTEQALAADGLTATPPLPPVPAGHADNDPAED